MRQDLRYPALRRGAEWRQPVRQGHLWKAARTASRPESPSGKKGWSMTEPLMCRKKDRLPAGAAGKGRNMEYEKFKEEIRERMQESLGPGTEVSFHGLERNNGVETEGLEVREQGTAAAPVLYLDELYGNCCKSDSMESAVSRALKLLEEKPPADIGAVPKTWEAAKGRIRAELVHYDWNRKILKSIPHRKFLNLAVTYRVELPESEGSYAGIRVNSSLMELWGATEDELYQTAMENLENERYHIQTIVELLGGMAGVPTGEIPELPEEMTKQYVLANESCRYGAAGMLRKDLMEGFAGQAGGSFYILPSSIHELILLPDAADICAEELKKMVKEVNESAVAREEWLSEDVYYYNCEEKKVTISIVGKRSN